MSVWPYSPVLYSSCSSETPSEKSLGKYQQMGGQLRVGYEPPQPNKVVSIVRRPVFFAAQLVVGLKGFSK